MEKNPKTSDDALTEKMIRDLSTFFNPPFFVIRLAVYPLWNIRTLENYFWSDRLRVWKKTFRLNYRVKKHLVISFRHVLDLERYKEHYSNRTS